MTKIDQPSLEDAAPLKDMAQAAALVGKACKIIERHDNGHGTVRYLSWSLRSDLRFLSSLAGRGRGAYRPRPGRRLVVRR